MRTDKFKIKYESHNLPQLLNLLEESPTMFQLYLQPPIFCLEPHAVYPPLVGQLYVFVHIPDPLRKFPDLPLLFLLLLMYPLDLLTIGLALQFQNLPLMLYLHQEGYFLPRVLYVCLG